MTSRRGGGEEEKQTEEKRDFVDISHSLLLSLLLSDFVSQFQISFFPTHTPCCLDFWLPVLGSYCRRIVARWLAGWLGGGRQEGV